MGIKKMVSAFWKGKVNEKGEEILDPKPLRVALGLPEDRDVLEEIRAMQSQALARAVQEVGFESEAEANDFGPDDDMDDGTPPSRHEERFTRESEELFDRQLQRYKDSLPKKPKKWKRKRRAADGSVSEEEFEEVI